MLNRGESRSPARSKIEFLMTRANGWKALIIIKKNSTPVPARVLDPILIIIKMVYKLNALFEKVARKQSRPKPISII